MIENIVKKLIDKLILEIKKEDICQKLEYELINPLLIHYTNKVYPYIIILIIFYFINLILIIIILVFIIMFYKEKNKILI